MSGHKLEANEGAAAVLPSTCQCCYINHCIYYLQKQGSLDFGVPSKGHLIKMFS